jgi:predicted DNA-binding transcriptional regulator AlpA
MTLLTTRELEHKLKVTAVTIWRWRNEGMPFLKLNNSIRFEEDKVFEWLKQRGR